MTGATPAGEPRSMDRELLFCLQALSLGLIDKAVLQEAGQAFGQGKGGLREEVLRRAALAKDDLTFLDRAVELMVRASGGDAHAAVEAAGGARRIAESLADALRLDATLSPAARTEKVVVAGPDASEAKTLARSQSGPTSLGSGSAEAVTAEAPARYDVRGEIGRGGIGRVLVAFDEHVGREIAIKELLGAQARSGTPSTGSQGATVRFLREARLTAQLEHPGIVPVYEVGQRADGTLYYAMRLVRGRTLSQALKECKGVGERLRLLPHFAEMCAAVAFAHSRGVLHRDLKPHNVMIGEFNETVLLDWGLAKLKGSEREDKKFTRQMEALRGEEADSGATLQGEAMGTPEYMPPEQAFGDLDQLDEHSDVYSLGAVLYELLTGRPPFTGGRPLEILKLVQSYGQGKVELAKVGSLAPEAPPELAAVAHKALSPQTHGRYRTAKDLLDDINAFMAGRRVGAYEYGSLELLKRVIAKNRAVSALLAALFLVLLFGSGALARAWRNAHHAELLVHRHLAAGYQEKAARLASERDYLGAQVFAAASLRESPYNALGLYPDRETFGTPAADEALSSLQSTLWSAHHLGMVRHLAELERAAGSVELVRFSPDGTRLAACGADRKVRVFSVADRRLVASREATAFTSSLAWSPDGKTLAYGSGNLLHLWKPDEKGEPLTLPGHEQPVASVVFAPDGHTLASSSRDGTVRLWDLASNRESGRLEQGGHHEGNPDRLAFSPDGGRLAVAGVDHGVVIWDLVSRTPATTLTGHESAVVAVLWASDGRKIYTLAGDRTVRTWDGATGAEQDVFTLSEGQPKGLAARFDDAGRPLLAIGRNEVVELWDGADGTRAALLRGHDAQVRSVAFSPDGKILATAGVDRRLHLWEVAARPSLSRLPGHSATVTALAISADGKRLFTGARDKSLKLWDLTKRRELVEWSADADVTAVALTPDLMPISAGRNGTITLWANEGREALASLAAPGAGLIGAIALSPDARLLASADADGRVRIWDLAGRRIAQVLVGHADMVSAVAFSPDGRTLASGGRDKTVRLWDPASGAKKAEFPAPERVRALAFSPDGALLAVSDQSWAIRLLDAATGEVKRTLLGHHDAPRTLVFSKEGRLLASAGVSDTTVRLWEIPSGRALQSLQLGGEVRAAALFPDGATVVAAEDTDILLAPVTLDLWRHDALKMLEESEKDAAMVLQGFALVPR